MLRGKGIPISILIGLTVVCASSLAYSQANDRANKAADDFFERRVRPLLANHCVECHGSEEQSGGLRLDSAKAMFKGGDSGLAVVAGSPEKSLLFSAVKRDGDLQMPPDSPLKPGDVDVLKRWIKQGAKWPKNTIVRQSQESASPHWAFEPIVKPAVPSLKSDWIQSPIDAFVLQQLKKNDLRPSPAADKRVLIRRAHYKLTGLPPSPGEVADFIQNREPNAYQQLIEQLLRSPHYGEKSARQWMDLARYSDTKGYVYAREERFWVHAWVYRDWLVKALNQDLPYDRFLLLQIAADQVATSPADLAAMGFLTVGRRFLGVTHDIIDDRIDVVTRGTMGLTVSCARCHDHKFDPIPTEDYYALYGVFQNSIESLEPLETNDQIDQGFSKQLKSQVDQLQNTMNRHRAETAKQIRKRTDEYLIAQLELHKYPEEGFDQIFSADDVLPAFVRRWRDFLIHAEKDHDNVFVAWRQFRSIPDEQFETEAIKICRQLQSQTADKVDPRVAAAFAKPPENMREVAKRYAQLFNEFCQQVAANDPAKPNSFKDDPLWKVLFDDHSPCQVPHQSIVNNDRYFPTPVTEQLWKLQKNVDRLLIDSPHALQYGLLLRDKETITDARVFKRGNPASLGPPVPRQPLGLLAGKDRQPFQQGSGRLEFAKSIIDPANPLTARVIVNRVWMQHFGQGLVRTPGDFGRRAEPPTHPLLLDWLAARLVEEKWSLKWLHREIMSSSTFQQSSQDTVRTPEARRDFANAKKTDPENRWLWRMSPHRLSFEEFWDSTLAVSGKLDRSVGGKSIDMFQSSNSQRRALYGRIDRQFLPSVLRVFDFASPDLPIPKRPETTVPQQALFAMNHPFMLRQARTLAKRSGVEANESDRARILWLYQAVYQRAATAEQLAMALELIESAAIKKTKPRRPQIADWQYGYGEYDEKTKRLINYTRLPHFNGSAWQGGEKWPDAKLGWVQLTADGGHAGNDRKHAAVRRFVAPRKMTVRIESKLVHQFQVGDGIRGFLVAGNQGPLKSAEVHNRKEDMNVARLQLEPGETVDFVVDLKQNLNHEDFLWEATITELASEKKDGLLGKWNSQRDFAGPKNEPLSPWEQLAQVLLVANEFIFID